MRALKRNRCGFVKAPRTYPVIVGVLFKGSRKRNDAAFANRNSGLGTALAYYMVGNKLENYFQRFISVFLKVATAAIDDDDGITLLHKRD